MTEPTLVWCPKCNGSGKGDGLAKKVRSGPFMVWEPPSCPVCHGVGFVESPGEQIAHNGAALAYSGGYGVADDADSYVPFVPPGQDARGVEG